MSDEEFRESLSFTKLDNEHITLVKQIDKVYKNGHCDTYTTETVFDKSTGESYPVSGTTKHESGWHNEKYFGTDNTTHKNNCGPNEYVFDQDNQTGERTYYDDEMLRK